MATKPTPMPIGSRWGRLMIIAATRNAKSGVRSFVCRCDCGQEKNVDGANLRNGSVASCGCLKRELSTERNRRKLTTHGQSRTPTWETWHSMRQRCLNPRAPNYGRYGGRGIDVDPRWLKFECFLADMGPRPSRQHSIDRINNDGNYQPGNCRWATAKEQANNRRPARHQMSSVN